VTVVAVIGGMTSHDIGTGVTILLERGVVGVTSDRADVADAKSTRDTVKLAMDIDDSVEEMIVLFVLNAEDEVGITAISRGRVYEPEEVDILPGKIVLEFHFRLWARTARGNSILHYMDISRVAKREPLFESIVTGL